MICTLALAEHRQQAHSKYAQPGHRKTGMEKLLGAKNALQSMERTKLPTDMQQIFNCQIVGN